MKKIINTFLCAFLMLTTLIARPLVAKAEENATAIQPESITLDKTELAIHPNEYGILKATVLPEGCEDTLTWESSDPSVVSVSGGSYSPSSPGTAIITATTVNGLSASCRITVTYAEENEVDIDTNGTAILSGNSEYLAQYASPDTVTVKERDVESVWLGDYYTHKDSFNLKINETLELSYTFVPYDAKDTLTVTSSDPNVATAQKINRHVIVAAVGEGSATITATAENGVSGHVEVHVEGYKILLEKFVVSEKNVYLQPNETYQLSAKVYPSNFPPQDIKWQETGKGSDLSGVSASVDENGLATATGTGTGLVTAFAYFDYEGKRYESDRCTVGSAFKETLTLDKEILWLKPGEEYDLKATLFSERKDVQIDWDYSDNNVLRVDENGHVTTVGEGCAWVYVYTSTYSASASCAIIVSRKSASTFTLTQDTIYTDLPIREPIDIWEYVEGGDPSAIFWSSNSNDIGVTQNRYIYAARPGEAIITGTTESGFSWSFKVVVAYGEVESFDFNNPSVEIFQNATIESRVSISSKGWIEIGAITLDSSDPSIVGVEEIYRNSAGIYFLLKGNKEGTANIICTAPNGISASMPVTVKGSIRFNYDRLDLSLGDLFQLEILGDYTRSPEDYIDGNIDRETLAGIANEVGRWELRYKTNKGTIKLPYTVKQRNPFPHEDAPELLPESITLNETEITLRKGGKASLTTTIQPGNVDDDRIRWFSSDRTIAYVDEERQIVARAYGTVTITAETVNGLQAKAKVTVMDPASLDLKFLMEGTRKYWYENGQRQGTYGDRKNVRDKNYGNIERGREIYDPKSNGWYWLDAVYDGAAAYGKEVWMPYIYQDEDNWDDAEIRKNANNADSGMKDFTYQCMKNKSGKWVRYDENGKMLKGWVTITGTLARLYPDQAGNTYYYDHYTGLMAKGRVTIDGKSFYFDEVSGVLKE